MTGKALNLIKSRLSVEQEIAYTNVTDLLTSLIVIHAWTGSSTIWEIKTILISVARALMVSKETLRKCVGSATFLCHNTPISKGRLQTRKQNLSRKSSQTISQRRNIRKRFHHFMTCICWNIQISSEQKRKQKLMPNMKNFAYKIFSWACALTIVKINWFFEAFWLRFINS